MGATSHRVFVEEVRCEHRKIRFSPCCRSSKINGIKSASAVTLATFFHSERFKTMRVAGTPGGQYYSGVASGAVHSQLPTVDFCCARDEFR